jgi:hypothetical protein
MANPEHVEIVKRGAEAIQEWRERNPGVRLDLSGADLSGANLSEANLGGANLGGANLIQANLSEANLGGANLGGANLIQANLIGANLSEANLRLAHLTWAHISGANLSGANLGEANLMQANLIGAILSGANLSGAIFFFSVLANIDLSLAEGLENTVHRGPSTVGVDTLFRSKGKIPKTFLRGCGVPDEVIAYLPSLLGAQQAIQFYSCFISYSHKDEEFCKRLHSRMRDEKLRVWYAPEDMKGGRKIHEQIDDAIRVHDKLLLVLSEQSMTSEWVKTEIRRARKREVREGRRVLFPIRLVSFDAIRDWEAFDADTGKDMGVEVREYFVPDFSNWKDHDGFEAGFKRLLDDLKAEVARDDDSSEGDGK